MTLENQSNDGHFDILLAFLEQFPDSPEADVLNVSSREEVLTAIERGVIEIRRGSSGNTYALIQRVESRTDKKNPSDAVVTDLQGDRARPKAIKRNPTVQEVKTPVAEFEEAEEVVKPERRIHHSGLVGYLEKVRCGDYWELVQMGFSPDEMVAAKRNGLIVAGSSPVTHRFLLAPADERYSSELTMRNFDDDLPYALGALYNSRRVVPPATVSSIPFTFLYEMTTHSHASDNSSA